MCLRRRILFIDLMVYQQRSQDATGLSAVIIEIIRTNITANSTMGTLRVNGEATGHALELPWRNKSMQYSIAAKQ